MPAPFAPHPVLLGSALHPDAARWIATVGPANVSAPRGRLISDTIRELDAANVWGDIDYLGVYTAENATCALTDWRARKTGTVTADPTFTADQGYAFNGTTQYLATGFIPSTDCLVATGTSFFLGAYERTNVASAGYAFGAANSSTQVARIVPRTAGDASQAALNAGVVTVQSSVTDSRGLSVSRSFGGTGRGYKNGVVQLSPTLTTPGSTLTSRELYAGCYNNNGTAASFRAVTIGYAVFGRPHSSNEQYQSLYDIMQRYMTKLGANV